MRTPEARFHGLADFPYEARYLEVDGHRLARIDEGDGHPVVFVHGVPTWSYLWRSVLPPVLDGGHRVVAIDQIGFGRSDKPPRDWFDYDRLVASFAGHLDAMELTEPITLVLHDWGGPVGLRWAVEHPDAVARLVLMDTGLYAGGGRQLSETWQQFRAMVAAAEELPVGQLVQLGSVRQLTDAEVAAYDAPFPDAASQGGVLSLPLLVPTSDDDPGAAAMTAARRALEDWDRPALVLWGEEDRVLRQADGERLVASFRDAGPLEVVEGGHFLQEDAGPRIGARIVEFIRATADAS